MRSLYLLAAVLTATTARAEDLDRDLLQRAGDHVRAYLQKLLLFRSPRFAYGDPRRAGDVVIVPTRIATVKDEYAVNYAMREREGRWVATDVIVEGISLTDNYRSQFASVLRDHSFSELLDIMRAKVRPAGPERAP